MSSEKSSGLNNSRLNNSRLNNSRLNKEISELEERIKARRASSSRHLEELQNTVSENITESQHNFHEKLSAPGTLLTAFGVGFILDRLGSLGSSRNKPEKSVAKARRKAERRQQKKTESRGILSRLKTTVTLVMATAAVLSRLDDYMDKINKKSAEMDKAGRKFEPRPADDYAAHAPSPSPAVNPDNSGKARP